MAKKKPIKAKEYLSKLGLDGWGEGETITELTKIWGCGKKKAQRIVDAAIEKGMCEKTGEKKNGCTLAPAYTFYEEDGK